METLLTSQLVDGSVDGVVLNSRDVTERRHFEEQLRHQALHDSLTGLPHRALFGDRLQQALAGQARRGGCVAVLLVDLDNFKAVNDTAGHLVGDALLEAVAARLRTLIRVEDTVARLGGDEFAVVAEALPSPEEADELAERGAAVDVPLELTCNAEGPLFVFVEVTQRVGRGIASGGESATFACTGSGQDVVVRVPADPAGQAFVRGRAVITAAASGCLPNICGSETDSEVVRLRR